MTVRALAPLQTGDVSAQLQETIGDVITFLPRLVGAILVLLIGWILGRVLAGLVRRLADFAEVDEMVLHTPLGRILGGTEESIARAFGTLAAWFVYAVAILAAADVLAIDLLSEWIRAAVSYLPAFLAGLLIIVFGFVIADFVGDAIERTRAATRTAYTRYFADGVRFFLYFVVIVIGLDTMQVDVDILYVFANAIAWGLAAAVAIAVGVAFGWGGKDFVSNNLDRWTSRANDEVRSGSGAASRTEEAPGGPGDADASPE